MQSACCFIVQWMPQGRQDHEAWVLGSWGESSDACCDLINFNAKRQL